MHTIWIFLSLLPLTCSAGEVLDIQSPSEIRAAHTKIEKDFANVIFPNSLDSQTRNRILAKYSYVDPGRQVPLDLLIEALIFFELNKNSFPNKNYISIVDFRPRSDEYRFYLVELATGKVERYHTTHGEGSDVENFARKFGNVNNSRKSSLGFVRTAEVYEGTYKRSLRLDGLSPTNSNLRDRAVIFHGYDDAHEANVIQGLTFGCIAMDWSVKDAVLDKIKDGSLMYLGIAIN